jgi:predicted nucleic acid-binding protein
MTLGDSIIAATALIYNLDLYTHNVSDFESIQDLLNDLNSTQPS